MATPECPACKSPMVIRMAKRGKFEGKQFWGCKRFPECKGVVPFTGEMPTAQPPASKSNAESSVSFMNLVAQRKKQW